MRPGAGRGISVGALPNDGSIYPVTFPPKKLWVRFIVYGAVGSNTGLAEIEVPGSCAVTPSVRVAAPLSEYLQTSTASLTATAQTCLDPVNNAAWGSASFSMAVRAQEACSWIRTLPRLPSPI